MSLPPLRPSSESPAASDHKSSSSGSTRPRQSVWGVPQPPSSRRGPAPLTTSSSSATAPDASAPSGSLAGPSLLGPSFSAVLNSSSSSSTGRFGTANNSSGSVGGRAGTNNNNNSSAQSLRTPSISSTSSLQQAGSQQLSSSQLLSSPRSQTSNTPFAASALASSAATPAPASQEGGGGSGSGGGGPSRSAAFSPSGLSNTGGVTSPASSVSERNPFSDRAGSTASASSVGKIVVTQVFLLLSSITEKEGKAKWETQAEAVRKLVYSNGMAVFAKYFRRLLVGNSPQIFPGINRNVENPANYQLLKEEVEKAAKDPHRAREIAEIIETGEGDIFRDFDLATFVGHFKLDAVHQTILASAFAQSNKSDLRSKAATLLSSNHHDLLKIFHGVDSADNQLTTAELAAAAHFLLRDLPPNVRDGTERDTVTYAFTERYSRQGQLVPLAIRSAIMLAGVMERNSDLAHEVEEQGPSVTSSAENAREFVRKYSRNQLDAEQIANTLLFMVMYPDGDQYQPNIFVHALKDAGLPNTIWEEVVSSFDRESLVIDSSQLLRLYRALEPIAAEDSTFDIQLLWGGQWRHRATQLSFAIAYASLKPEQLNAKDIPNLRKAYDPREWDDVPEECADLVEQAIQDPLISLDAVTAIINGLWDPKESEQQDVTFAKQVISSKIVFFLASAGCLPKPWVPSLQSLMAKTLVNCLQRTQSDYQWILHCFWKQDKTWLASRLVEAHTQEPLELANLLDHAREHHWLEDLLTMVNAFGIDLAALAHKQDLIDLRQWAEDKLERSPRDFAHSLARFLLIKTQDEMRTVRKEQPSAMTVSLAMKTAHAMLELIDENWQDGDTTELAGVKRHCMQAFPRLCNYGEGFDEIIEENGAEGNTLSPLTDAEMSELYKKMYSEERDVRSIVEMLRDCKTSKERSRQELFACMIHGLFDEFVCFNEYPPGPLSTTAVLFGGLIGYSIVSGFALDVALDMVLESVRGYPPDSLMFKFGAQALMHVKPRLREWKDFARKLLQIPGLQGTPIYGAAQEALSDDSQGFQAGGPNSDNLRNGKNSANGHSDDIISHDALVPQFQSVNPDPLLNVDQYQDPTEGVQDKVLFVLNNVTEQNLATKIGDILTSLEPDHHQWFASYLVEQRAKSQPNYQVLYLEILRLISDKGLWMDVLRETYVSVRKVLNAEATMKNASDRAQLKNLGTWLGLLTLARDKPIKHKNLAFKELLIEGWETQRLLLVIPFTCEVLAQGAKSIVFKPPNPWLMDVIALLLELYDLPDTKIQQKFAVEVLLGTFGLPRNGEGMERSTELKKRQQRYETELTEPMMPDGIEAFEEVGMGHLNRGLRTSRMSPTTIAATLPDLSNLLVYPPALSSPINNAKFRQIVQAAVRNAILEMIGPVVERSVTIATIATKDLVAKDYSQEADETKLREAFQTMAKATSGSLASVTCKEPLRGSIANNIRNAAAEIQGENIAEGIILMCVNDNIEIACKIIEKQAEERALPEIKPVIDAEIQKRQAHKANLPNESYKDPNTNHWASYIPEPYKQVPGGLNRQQLDIYEHFGPQVRGTTTHGQTASTDSGKQIPDVLQEASFPNMPNLSTPAEPPVLPHQSHSQMPSGHLNMADVRTPSQLNGYVDANTIQDHLEGALNELARLTRENPDQRYKDLGRDSPMVEVLTRIIHLVRTAQDSDQQALQVTSFLHRSLYSPDSTSRFEVEVLGHAIKEMCILSSPTLTKLSLSIHRSPEEQLMAPLQTAVLLEVELIEFGLVDSIFMRRLATLDVDALRHFEELLDLILFVDEPIALRGDFAGSLAAIGDWYAKTPESEDLQRIVNKLKDTGIPDLVDLPGDHETQAKQAQMRYIFQEWAAIFNQPHRDDSVPAAFFSQLHAKGAFQSQEDLSIFMRYAFELAAESFERAARASHDFETQDAHYEVDALARFTMLMVKTGTTGDAKLSQSKAAHMKRLLFLVVLILNNHHVVRGEQFSQRTFFRFFSSLLYDWHDLGRGSSEEYEDQKVILAFGEAFLMLAPKVIPGFTYAWLQLVSHRVFLPAILKQAGDEGPELFASLMEMMLSHVSRIVWPDSHALVGKELYDGALRILLILHHDFPEFLAENHYRLCDVIPSRCTQLRNLVLSAFPSAIYELPDPFTTGLKVDRLEEIHKPPALAGDPTKPLEEADLKDLVDEILKKGSPTTEDVSQLVDALVAAQAKAPFGIGSPLGQALVLYLGSSAVPPSGSSSPVKFDEEGPHMALLTRLVFDAPADAQFYLFNAVVNQLRYPNSHTFFFSHALLHLFGVAGKIPAADTGSEAATSEESIDTRQHITRVLLERLIVHRPHPWGLIITLLELLKNPSYSFWELPFIKAAPEVTTIISRLVDLEKLAIEDKSNAALPIR